MRGRTRTKFSGTQSTNEVANMKLIQDIQLFGNAFVVNLQDGTKLTYRIGKKAQIYIKRNPAGLIWTEPVASYDAVGNLSILDNYIIHSEKPGKGRQ